MICDTRKSVYNFHPSVIVGRFQFKVSGTSIGEDKHNKYACVHWLTCPSVFTLNSIYLKK